MRNLCSLASISCLLTFAACQGAAPEPTIEPLVLEPCQLPGLEEEVRCGTHEVYENRTTREGRKIPLRVAVMPATGPDPAPDPVYYFAGGPGDSAIDNAPAFAFLLENVRQRRDLVLVDVRGTGQSNPLTCDYQDKPRGIEEALESFIPTEELPRCLADLSQQADLTQYTTPILVDDVDEVRQALGHERINLMGGSYGTRAALVYLRRHPESVRTVVLEGLAPPFAKVPEAFARDAQAAIEGLYAECAADTDCNTAFPDPAGDLASVLDRLASAPTTVEITDPETNETRPFTLTRNAFVQTVRYMLYQPLGALQIPFYVHEAAQGQFEPIAQNAYNIAGNLLTALPDGLYLSITCTEDIPFIDFEAAVRDSRDTFLGDFRLRQQRAACEDWPRGTLPDGFSDPVRSDAPVLLVSGERDPVTPPYWGERTAQTLPNSVHVVVPDGAHGNFGLRGAECVDALSADFVERGGQEGFDPEPCLAQIERPAFLTTRGDETPIELPTAALEALTGTYSANGGLTMTVRLDEDTLLATLLDDVLTLIPVTGGRFLFSGAPPGSYLTFASDASRAEIFQGGNPVLKLDRTP